MIHIFIQEEVDLIYTGLDHINCSKIHLSWISRQATCFQLDLSGFEARSTGQQVEVGLDLSYLYGEFLAYVEHYERNFTWGSSGLAWYTQASTLSLGGPRRQLHYYGVDVCTARPGFFSKHLVEISDELQDSDLDDCSDRYPSLSDCLDHCHASRLDDVCGHRCVPFAWESLLRSPGSKQKHCSLGDYSACLKAASDSESSGEDCRSLCKPPCARRHHRLTLVSQGPLPREEGRPVPTGEPKPKLKPKPKPKPKPTGSILRLAYGSLRYRSQKSVGLPAPYHGPHELIALLGGAANFWLGLSVAGLLHLLWFLAYELPRVKVAKGHFAALRLANAERLLFSAWRGSRRKRRRSRRRSPRLPTAPPPKTTNFESCDISCHFLPAITQMQFIACALLYVPMA